MSDDLATIYLKFDTTCDDNFLRVGVTLRHVEFVFLAFCLPRDGVCTFALLICL
jgi:hypothetical protein